MPETTTIDHDKITRIVDTLSQIRLPLPSETTTERFPIYNSSEKLANAYLAVVAICHQTSPIGERSLAGMVNGIARRGWDYLRARFLMAASELDDWTSPCFWQQLSPERLAELYEDKESGKTLNRVSERTYLLNDLGEKLTAHGHEFITEVFDATGNTIEGENGLLQYLSTFLAYSDPVRKKSYFFLSLAESECEWKFTDRRNCLSPVDYHELRGHIRIGTVVVKDELVAKKLRHGLPLTDEEDTPIREQVQRINEVMARDLHVSGSTLHYFLWNFFRACCKRGTVHCEDVVLDSIPAPYKDVLPRNAGCMFRRFCDSAQAKKKADEPSYIGHFY